MLGGQEGPCVAWAAGSSAQASAAAGCGSTKSVPVCCTSISHSRCCAVNECANFGLSRGLRFCGGTRQGAGWVVWLVHPGQQTQAHCSRSQFRLPQCPVVCRAALPCLPALSRHSPPSIAPCSAPARDLVPPTPHRCTRTRAWPRCAPPRPNPPAEPAGNRRGQCGLD